jgi:hypothetical protein
MLAEPRPTDAAVELLDAAGRDAVDEVVVEDDADDDHGVRSPGGAWPGHALAIAAAMVTIGPSP